MSGRKLYLATYDVSDAKRLRRIHKIMRNFGEALQYSVFQCRLTGTERIRLLEALHAAMDLTEDRVMLADLGPASGRGAESVEWIGRAPQEPLFDQGSDQSLVV